jgi:transposase-like protein
MEIETRSKTLQQLAHEYGVCTATFRKWIKPIKVLMNTEETRKRIYKPKEIKIIYEHLGKPKIIS